MNHYYTYLLRQIMERGEILSIFADESHPDEFIAGAIEQVDGTHYLICELTPWGEVDAFRVRRLQDIHSILYGDEYEFRLKLIIDLSGQKFKRVLPKGTCDTADGVLLTVMKLCRETQEIVSLYIGEEIYNGRIRECNGLYVTMDLFDFYGVPGTVQTFSLRDIEILQFRSPEENMYARLENWQQEKAGKKRTDTE